MENPETTLEEAIRLRAELEALTAKYQILRDAAVRYDIATSTPQRDSTELRAAHRALHDAVKATDGAGVDRSTHATNQETKR